MKTRIEKLEEIIKDLRNKRDKETKRRNEIQDKLEDKIEELERKNEKLKSHLRFIKGNI
jgi:uncharacterized FlaG/YvyC family protein